jgi:hypothetical protein
MFARLSKRRLAGYVYDPQANTWSPIPHLPIDLWGGASSVANGELLISGGVTAQSTVVTNQGYAFSPATDAWTPLPNAPEPLYLSAGACGFYQIGGIGENGTPVAGVAQLPGYGGCGGPSWLTARPSQLTLAPGHSARVTVLLDAASPSVTQPGTYTATLQFSSDTAYPYPAPTLPVRLTATPPASWGRLAGTVTGRSCNGHTAPLPGATVQVNGAHGTWTLTTGQNGRYTLWLDKDNSPATLIASQPGWQPQVTTAHITPQATTTRNFTLAQATGCG